MNQRFIRFGRTSPAVLLFFGSAIMLALLVGLLAFNLQSNPTSAPSQEPLVVFCAAGLKGPVEAIATEYTLEYGVPVQLQYGGSQTQLANLEISRVGDLFIPADESYIQLAQDKKLIQEKLPIGTMRLTLAVKKGNPHGITSLDDLLQKKVRVGQANPDAAAVGKITRDTLQPLGKWEPLEKMTTVFKPTVNEVATDIRVGAVDAGIVWDALIHQFPDLELVATEEFQSADAKLIASILTSSKQPTAALRFARYLTAADKGLKKFESFGYHPTAGDPWQLKPEITLYAGSMLRPAIEATIAKFQAREGVQVNSVYNGCGILVAQMKAGQMPDAYFACDKEFMDQVQELFPGATDIARNQLVILVKKGNPHKIASLRDLGKDGLRVGIGHEKQCAMGWLTQKTFEQSGVKTLVMKNVTVQTPTGDMLVNQMRTGSLDAAVAYLSNATNSGDYLDAIRIDGIPCSTATQPFGIAKKSEQQQLVARLYEAIRSAESQEQFISNGFEWGLEVERK